MTVRFKVTYHDEEFIPPDESRAAAVTVRVIVNGLVAGKATLGYGEGYYSLLLEQGDAETLARKYAIDQARARMAKWAKGVEQFAEWESHQQHEASAA